MGVSTIKTPG